MEQDHVAGAWCISVGGALLSGSVASFHRRVAAAKVHNYCDPSFLGLLLRSVDELGLLGSAWRAVGRSGRIGVGDVRKGERLGKLVKMVVKG